jgi:cation transport ATPase
MKKGIFILFVVFSFTTKAQFKNIQMQAAGLTCAMCSNSIQKALKPLPFIESIIANVKTSTFSIKIKEGMQPDFDMIVTKVENAGYSVANLKVDVNLSNLKISNDVHTQILGYNIHFLNVKPQTINGWTTIQIVDKSFLTATEYKKYSKATTMPCYKTGKIAACCSTNGTAKNNRIYHVTI